MGLDMDLVAARSVEDVKNTPWEDWSIYEEVKNNSAFYNYETGEYDLDGNYNDESDASSYSDDGDDGPKFGESERHERTADGKISISGRDLFKD